MNAHEVSLIEGTLEHLPRTKTGEIVNQGKLFIFGSPAILYHVWPRLQAGQKYAVYPQVRVIFTKKNDRKAAVQSLDEVRAELNMPPLSRQWSEARFNNDAALYGMGAIPWTN